MLNVAQSRCDRDDLIVLPDDHVIGEGTAPVTIIAYCDFECPYCRQAHAAVGRLRARFTDRVRFVYRHFPLVKKHPHAQLAAEASVAAALQGRFWPMHDVLFENQTHLTLDDLHRYAAMAGLDVPRFKDDLHMGAGVLKVRRDEGSGHRCGVQGTPTFFVNGLLLSDNDELERTVSRHLSNKKNG
ncbi:DsbA family protein [Candidatus Nitrospira nitrificans]|uniref:Na(+)/H(+) antiporter NhaA 2 n=1 Tax=Candidatus Nitrospira nitrificans TaxID=1742973 RepID=A0A0S4LST3_9BACT